MGIEVKSIPGEVVVSPDSLARVKRILRTWSPVAVGVVVVLVVLGVWFRHSIHWGDGPTWLLAITTLLAFLAAAFAGIVTYDLLRVETSRDQHAAQERRRAQATEVFTWAGDDPGVRTEEPRLAGFVRNASSRPIYDISIGWGGAGADSTPALLPGKDYVARGAGLSAMQGTHAEFRDAAGLRWRTTSAGLLTELPPANPQAGDEPSKDSA